MQTCNILIVNEIRFMQKTATKIYSLTYRLIILLFFTQFATEVLSQNQIPLLRTDSFAISTAKTNAEKARLSGDMKEESRYYDDMAIIYWEHNIYQQAIDWFLKSLALNEKLTNLSGMSMINSNLGLIYADMESYEKSLLYFQKTLDFRKMNKEKVGTISCLINMSVVLNNLQRYDESAKLLGEALTIAREMNDMEQMKSCYGMLSETYEKAKQADKAKYYFDLYRTFHEKIQSDKEQSSNKIVEETKLQMQLVESEKRNQELKLLLTNKELKSKEQELVEADSMQKKLYSNFSKVELQNELLKKDILIKNISIQKEKTSREKQNAILYFLLIVVILFVFLAIALYKGYYEKKKTNNLLKQKNTEIEWQKNDIENRSNLIVEQNEKLELQQVALCAIVEELRATNEIIKEYNAELEKLSIVASQTDNAVLITDGTGNIEYANAGFSKMYGYSFEEFKTSFVNIMQKNSNELVTQHICVVIQTKKTHIYEVELISKSGTKIWVQTTVTPILNENNQIEKLVFIDSNITKVKESEKRIWLQKNEIEEQKKRLTDSINYARYIQTAMFNRNTKIDTLGKDSFLIFKPKDVVSGDFYWLTQIDETFVIAVADCTGHGVPCAFMSMLGMNLLSQIVEYKRIIEPNLILTELNNGIRFALNQEENKSNDGMDVAICTIDLKNKQLQFSGAMRSLLLIQNNEMKMIKGTKASVGGTNLRDIEERYYELNSIDIIDDTLIYLFTDGYTDQFGEASRRRFSTKRFTDIVSKYHEYPFFEQKIILEDALIEWQGDENQVDDITVLGIKI